jgi:GTP-binding protein HflX
MKVEQNNQERERFIVATLLTPKECEEEVLQSLEELENLIETAGGQAVGRIVQKRDAPDPKTFLGRGKAENIAHLAREIGATALAVDTQLSPSQQRNLEEITDLKVLDRTAIILDIFATRARSLEGKLQVELAQLTYLQSRLIGKGVELSRLGGGIGTRGPGETKLEVDRRRLKKRIQTLKRKLKEIEEHRQRLRSARKKGAFQISLVGYTNAGKSTLLNALTGAGVYASDQLFATLDPTARRINIRPQLLKILSEQKLLQELSKILDYDVVLSDTVGFINNLPAELVAAFHSTLEEVVEADILLHVVNSLASNYSLQLAVVEETLERIGAANVPKVLVFNKIDLLTPLQLQRLKDAYPQAVFISALKGTGIVELKEKIARVLISQFNYLRLSRSRDL